MTVAEAKCLRCGKLVKVDECSNGICWDCVEYVFVNE